MSAYFDLQVDTTNVYDSIKNKPNLVHKILVTNFKLLNTEIIKKLIKDNLLDVDEVNSSYFVKENVNTFRKFVHHNFGTKLLKQNKNLADIISILPIPVSATYRKEPFLDILFIKKMNNPYDLYIFIRFMPQFVHRFLYNCNWSAYKKCLIELLINNNILDINHISTEYDGPEGKNINFKRHVELQYMESIGTENENTAREIYEYIFNL
jgi:hypothetical protein